MPGIRGSSPQKSESTSLRWAAPFNCCAKWERFGKIIDFLGARIGAFWNGSFLLRVAEMGMENLPLPHGARRVSVDSVTNCLSSHPYVEKSQLDMLDMVNVSTDHG